MEILIEHLFKKKKKNEAYSVFTRNIPLIKNKHIKYKFSEQKAQEAHYQYLENRLLTNDDFLPSSVITDPTQHENYLKMSDLGISEKQVLFIDHNNFSSHENIFLKDKALGLDCEFRSADCTNFASTKIATLQVASETQCAIFDVMNLEQSSSFVFWLRTMLESPEILKLGHSFDGDVRVLNQTFGLEMEAQNLINVEKLEEGNRIKGLKTLVNEYMGKEFCKFNQMSAWFQRPLRRAQMHYGALDAMVMIPLWRKMKEGKKEEHVMGEKEKVMVEFKVKKKKKGNKHKGIRFRVIGNVKVGIV
jgi:hypothetical protein